MQRQNRRQHKVNIPPGRVRAGIFNAGIRSQPWGKSQSGERKAGTWFSRQRKEKELYKYYSTQRPVMPGGFPKEEAATKVENFGTKTFCKEIGKEAWGFIEYREPLKKEDADAYELTQGGMRTFWCVTTSVDDRGTVRAAVTSFVEAVSKPENSSRSTSRKDIYHDWFESREEAVENENSCNSGY